MSKPPLRAAILIISDTASRDPSTDSCIPTLTRLFQTDPQWPHIRSAIVPDNVLDIQRSILQWTDSPDAVNLVVTSGGTGFAVKDVTPEAITPLIHRHAPGLVHGMLAASLKVTPFAMMARPVAGVRNGTLILTLPGSPKGAGENLQAVLKLLPHACEQAMGGSSRELHVGGVKKLEKEAGVGSGGGSGQTKGTHVHDHASGHTHGHHAHAGHAMPVRHTASNVDHQSNNPLDGPTHRHRESPYPMLSVPDALSLIASTVPIPQPISHAVNHSLIGHVLAEDAYALEAVPAFRASIVDGYAVRLPDALDSDTSTIFPVAFASHAQAADIPTLQLHSIARITTGAPLPPGADAVVMVEDTRLISRTPDGREESTVEVLVPMSKIAAGENVREIGSDVSAGSIVLRAGEGISSTGGEFGLLASVGVQSVRVFRRPIVGVLSTGDELVPHDESRALRLGEVRDTNRPTLLMAACAAGFKAVDLGIAEDKNAGLESAIRAALARVDVLVTSGGVSMGELDLLKPTIERSLGGTIHFGRVSMKPGKPTTFATVPAANIKTPETGDRGAEGTDKVVFSLPGNPASAVVTFGLFVLPALHQMSGVKPAGLPRVSVRLESEILCDKTREEYHRVLIFDKADEGLWASSTGGQRSSRIGSFKGANGLVKLPAGGGRLAKGQKVEALLMGGL